MSVLTLNLLFMTFVFAVAARIYVFPRIDELGPKASLLPILLLHATRNLGMMFLSPGATFPGLPPEFIYPAAYGDLTAAVLALLSIGSIVLRSRFTRPLLWIFSIEGTVDLLAAITLATYYKADVLMGPAYWIPAFFVPALLVTHYIVFVLLLRGPAFWQKD